MKISVADLLLKYLENEGIEYIFGIPGTELTPLFNSLKSNKRIKPVLTKHETGAAFMADGYARIKKRPGACFAAAGAGLPNLMAGIASSYSDSVPVVALTGQASAKSRVKGILRESNKYGGDPVSMLNCVTKYNSMIINKYKAEIEIREAFRTAVTGRKGPVHLSLPSDILDEEIECASEGPLKNICSNKYFDRQLVIDAAKKLVNAKSPAILIGEGAVISDASFEIIELAETLGIPVATTAKAKGAFPEKHPLSLGILGLGGSPIAAEYLKSGNIDVLLVIGASLNEIINSPWDALISPSDCLIHINIDPSELGKNYKAEIPLVGDANTVVNEIGFRVLRYMDNFEPVKKKRIRHIQQMRSNTGDFFEPEKILSDSVPVKPQRIIKEIEKSIPENSILFANSGSYLAYALHYLKWNTPGTFIASGLGSTGYGVCAAIGGKLAAPDKPVISIADGSGFLTSGMEISTAVNYNIPVIWIIQNNSKNGFANEYRKFNLNDQPSLNTFCKETDFCKIAQGLGAKGYAISKPGELTKVLTEAVTSNKPVVIDCVVDTEETFFK